MSDILYCHTDGFMERSNEQFCVAGKSYEVVYGFDEDPEKLMMIIDERGEEHEFSQRGIKEFFKL